MKICVAQTRPVKGDIKANIASHKKFIELALIHGATTIIFPELSITGYESELAKDLATDVDDKIFSEFQDISDANNITIGIGMPIRKANDVQIGMILFKPGKARELYCKQHLHSDEFPFFVEGNKQIYLEENGNKAALAICYEISVPAHPEKAYADKANIYLASVAKTAESAAGAARILAETARKYSMTVLMSNCIGPCDNFISAGKSAVWDNKGNLIGELDEVSEGILIYDTETGNLVKAVLG